MTWFKVDHHFSSHPAVWKAGDSAMGLWLRLGCWLATFPQRLDVIPVEIAKHYGTKTQIRRLLEAGLLVQIDDDNYRLNPSMAIAGSGLPGRGWDIDESVTRRSIPPRLRAQVYDRDGRACVACGAASDLSLDHIYPHSLGGEDTLENLRTLCRSCNSTKGARV